MSRLKILTAITLVCSTLLVTSLAVFAAEYNVGVSAGHWIRYGNFLGIGEDTPSDLNQTAWIRMEITAVSGKNVTLSLTGKYKNETDINATGLTTNIETGWTNQSLSENFLYLIAANLQENDIFANLSTPSGQLKINKTETRTYLGASRTVNIFNLTETVANEWEATYYHVYDKVSGALLEANLSMTMLEVFPQNAQISFSMTDTNIFATGIGAWLQENTVHIATIIVVFIIAITVYAVKGKKPETTQTETEAQPTVEETKS